MTTIAYRSGTLAADSQIAYSNYLNGQRPKITQCGRFHVALAGKAWLRRPLEEWLAAGADEANVPVELMENQAEFSCLIVDDDGVMLTFDRGYLLPVDAPYAAIGSGMFFAMGAMAHGASAEEAVAAAMAHDKNTGGPITVVRFPLH
jgi:hypothetical protein